MNESISRAAGADHGQELSPVQIEAIAAEQGRSARQRTTLYGVPDAGQQARSYAAQPLSPLILTAPRARSLEGIV
jgi:FO synthase